jgi:glycosyltransferase involved in cell wall biosynthesis
MAVVVMCDDGIRFDGDSLASGPLGGAETAFVSLAEALAARGHEVRIHNNCAAPMTRNGVAWTPLETGVARAGRCDLYIANRGDRLLNLMPGAARTVFWIHNPAGYLLKWRYLSKLWRRRPAIVFSGRYHADSYPRWAPCGERAVIPYGIRETFRRAAPPDRPPPPRAVFTSSPLRSLDWLLDVWADRIYPELPAAELHVFSGPAVYGAHGAARAARMTPVLDKARALAAKGVVLRDPVPKDDLIAEFATARALLYRGDPGETFCLAVGEAQAAGVPAVVQDIGCVAERVVDGTTGFVADDAPDFATASLRLLRDDDLWRRQSRAAIASQRSWGWDDAAAAFEKLIPADPS